MRLVLKELFGINFPWPTFGKSIYCHMACVFVTEKATYGFDFCHVIIILFFFNINKIISLNVRFQQSLSNLNHNWMIVSTRVSILGVI
ncbi:hypothetical protein Glove_23g53 [Diversispora epigaea]|uniref:Uncharacterized protein n=1 Tax=Diversispora epigaea TaxID=1348612 RepID=A0A397JTU3_9GLOM|nr:hypothetical protein Glove_23g53 [Diversispora epigaea]